MIQPHAVPQNILDVEFKLFGSLTIKQFAYVAGAIMTCLLCYAVFSANSLGIQLLRWITVSFFGLLGLMLAFYKVNERSFDTWLTNYVVALFRTQKSIYVKSQKSLDIFDDTDDPRLKQPATVTKSAISDYKAMVSGTTDIELTNKAKTDLDKREEDNLDRIDVLFANTFTRMQPANNIQNTPIQSNTPSHPSAPQVSSRVPSNLDTLIIRNKLVNNGPVIESTTKKEGFIQKFVNKRNAQLITKPIDTRTLVSDEMKPKDIENLKRHLDMTNQAMLTTDQEEKIDPTIVIKLREQLAKRMQTKLRTN